MQQAINDVKTPPNYKFHVDSEYLPPMVPKVTLQCFLRTFFAVKIAMVGTSDEHYYALY
jgi:hypothetical protein